MATDAVPMLLSLSPQQCHSGLVMPPIHLALRPGAAWGEPLLNQRAARKAVSVASRQDWRELPELKTGSEGARSAGKRGWRGTTVPAAQRCSREQTRKIGTWARIALGKEAPSTSLGNSERGGEPIFFFLMENCLFFSFLLRQRDLCSGT